MVNLGWMRSFLFLIWGILDAYVKHAFLYQFDEDLRASLSDVEPSEEIPVDDPIWSFLEGVVGFTRLAEAAEACPS